MKICVFVGLAVLAQVTAQNFGPVPPRPQFVGASLVQGPRPNFRQRGAVRAVAEPIPPGQPIEPPQLTHRLRKPQVARTRPQFVQQQFDQQRSNVIDDATPIQYKPKIALPTPLPLYQASQPLPQAIPQHIPSQTIQQHIPPQSIPQHLPQPIPAQQQLPQQTQPQKLLTPRPVVEEESNEASEEVPTPATTPSTTTAFTAAPRPAFPPAGPAVLQPNPIPVAFQRPQFVPGNALRPQTPPQPLGFPEAANLQARQLIRPQVRPALDPSSIPVVRPIPQQVLKPKEDPRVDAELQYYRQQQQQTRGQKKQEPIPREQILDQEPIRQKEPARQLARQQQSVRPIQRESHVKAPSQPREKKPVAQTIRKYHEENEDGSITWGYENDDGSFKEETIGVDCVTRGRYGYFDPDGVKREYSYQTGIPCDRRQDEEEAASHAEGFIDYTNNKYVLPNGDEIDLEAMVKNRARKPVPGLGK